MTSRTDKVAVVIVDCGLGNIGSIANMFKKVGVHSLVTRDPVVVARAQRVILPGVGAFGSGMKQLEASGVVPGLEEAVQKRRIPTLGICLGAQLLTRSSEEGDAKGLGWMPARTTKFKFEANAIRLKVPHMGWNVAEGQKPHPFHKSEEEQRFYFVHSYHVVLDDPGDSLFETEYGIRFTSGYQRGNLMGVQFHPEKSRRFGMHILKSFATCDPRSLSIDVGRPSKIEGKDTGDGSS